MPARSWSLGARRLAGLTLAVVVGCADSPGPLTPPTPTTPSVPLARFELNGTVLGPVAQDDDADMTISLRETGGGEATINFFRVTCTNGVQVEWGAGGIVRERGTNRVFAFETVTLIRHYRCPDSSRPAELIGDLTDSHGSRLSVVATPTHPDWPR